LNDALNEVSSVMNCCRLHVNRREEEIEFKVLKDKVPRAELLTLAYKAQVLCELTLSNLSTYIATTPAYAVTSLQCDVAAACTDALRNKRKASNVRADSSCCRWLATVALVVMFTDITATNASV
jgi:hypothetical protein